MVEKRRGKARREVIPAVPQGVPAGLLLRISADQQSEKMPRSQAKVRTRQRTFIAAECARCSSHQILQGGGRDSAERAGASLVLAD